MTNSDAFKRLFGGLYASELWAMPEDEFLRWLKGDYGNRDMVDNDLISRAAAIECAIDAVDDWDGGWNPNRETVIRKHFEELPAVDAAPVVRCRDCKYAHMTYDGEVKYCDRISMPDDEGDYGYALYLPGDWFCASGERRESE